MSAPYAEEHGPREYSVFTAGDGLRGTGLHRGDSAEDVRVRVQCPPSPHAKLSVNVDMEPLLD